MDGTAGATQPTLPRLPQLTSLHRCHLPYCPYHRFASIRPPRGNSRCQSELLPVAPGFSAAYFLTPFFALLLLPPLRVTWLCLSAVQALLGFLFPCSLLLGFSAASSLPPFCAAPVASAAGLFAFPQLRLATSLISLALLLCLAVLRLMLRCLDLLRLLPSSSLCLVRVLLSFGRGLWLRLIPVLWLRFLRLLFLTFACLRLRWCLP